MMRQARRFRLWWCSAFCALLLCSGAAVSQPDSRKDLDDTIAMAIAALEKADHRRFVEQFLYPADLQALLEDVSMDELVDEFSTDHAQSLLIVLKNIRTRTPDLSRDGDEEQATYQLAEPVHGNNSIRLARFEGNWYIRN